jgi:hypothetical protein
LTLVDLTLDMLPNMVPRTATAIKKGNQMSETEQAEATWRIAMAMPDVAALIAKDARENLGGVEVVSVGSVFAREIQGVICHAVVAIVPDRDGKDGVPSQVIVDVTQNYTVACVNRMTFISCLEDHFARVQVFGTELALAKYCQREWPSEEMDQVIAEMKRGLN